MHTSKGARLADTIAVIVSALKVVVVMFQAFGWYIVSLYIATYATALGFNSTTSTGILSAFNASAIVGYLVTGPVIDKLSFTLAMATSSGLCSLTAFLLFGFATTLPIVIVFALVFGAAVSLRPSTNTDALAELTPLA